MEDFEVDPGIVSAVSGTVDLKESAWFTVMLLQSVKTSIPICLLSSS